eukprot:CAMPEP_0172560290 /NCGR_PEP_ID=MMETSP1067-20121228/87978_1 /TAXON_ID=265564 ORGANISM="Thalassiosira punctigera, Strain Tpunct2005C2" /NCGR_SAMPLE_ID=MMETSP1067 /ASSEMBLY_ACC=CAM_ASM_000444 /LENGTH=63 /DNA_ID=CAMNT_0013350053 /DNA_START=93 /DNA_END=284 /DNA_ORIENTATION=+
MAEAARQNASTPPRNSHRAGADCMEVGMPPCRMTAEVIPPSPPAPPLAADAEDLSDDAKSTRK